MQDHRPARRGDLRPRLSAHRQCGADAVTDMIELSENAALIIVDMQKAIEAPYWAAVGPRNNPQAERTLRDLLTRWRASGRPVVIVRHDSREDASAFRPDTATHAFLDGLEPLPGDIVIGKCTNSAFIATDLAEILKKHGITDVFFAGVKTNNSVEATVRMSGNLGLRSFLIEDCCFTFAMRDYAGVIRSAQEVHDMALANMAGEYCQIVTSQELIFPAERQN